MFSSPAISCAGRHPIDRHVNQLWSKPQRHGAAASRRFNLHSHLSNENTKPRLAEPALHHSAYMWLCLHAALFFWRLCVNSCLSGRVSLHMCVSTCVKPKWHSVSCILDDVTLLRSWWMRGECWWCTDTSTAWCPRLTDELTCAGVHFVSLALCHSRCVITFTGHE